MARSQKDQEQFSPEETKRRFEAALKGARVAGAQPKTVAPKPATSKRKKNTKKA